MASRSVRILTLILGLVVLLGAAFLWSQRRHGFPTPQACVEAFYRTASARLETPAWPECLTPSLQETLDRPWHLQRLNGVKNWVQVGDPAIDDRKAQVAVDETHQGGRQRLRYHLKRQDGGWLIDAIDTPQPLPEHVPYGTHVSKEGP